MSAADLAQSLRSEAREADALHAQARDRLVAAVRRGYAHGLSQREIAEAVGRSQPEVSRLLHFLPKSPRGQLLAKNREAVRAAAREVGVRNLRVFGSVALGTDGPESDVDLLADVPSDLSLFALGRLEQTISRLVGSPVDLVPAHSLRASMRERILREAVPL